MLLMVLQGCCLLWPDDVTDIYHWPLFELFGRNWTFCDFIIMLCFLSGMQYNIDNLYHGYKNAKDKKYALQIIAPYAQFLLMMYVSSFSRFYETRALRFIFISGLFCLYANCYLNLCTMCLKRFDWVYLEPYVFFGIVALDYNRVITD